MEYGRRQAAAGVVVAIECVAGGSRAEEWGPGSSETVQTGDVVEELRIGVGARGGATAHAAPFKGGRAALQKLLHAAYKRGDTSVEVRVRRPAQAQAQQLGDSGELLAGTVEVAAATTMMQACIVPQEAAVGGGGGGVGAVVSGMGMVGRSRQYVLRSIRDPNYAVGLVDRMESECVAFRGNNSNLQPHGTVFFLMIDRYLFVFRRFYFFGPFLSAQSVQQLALIQFGLLRFALLGKKSKSPRLSFRYMPGWTLEKR